jgi:VCBS repeat-containing protein/YVTN family beta-propeller protein
LATGRNQIRHWSFVVPLSASPSNALNLNLVSTLQLPGAEITAFDPGTDTLWVTSGTGLRIVNFSNPAAPVLQSTINFTAAPYNFSNDVNSVAIKNGLVAVAINAPTATNNGRVFLFNTDGSFIKAVDVGAVPDNLVFTPDGSKILVANEAESTIEPGAQLAANPEGSISIIDLSGGAANATVATAGFSAFNSQANALIAEGVRLFVNSTVFQAANGGAGTTVAQDLEPEYIAISPDGTKAFVTLQEANSIAIVDIATATVEDIVALGLKDWSGLPFDGSDRDLGPAFSSGTPSFVTGRPIFGLYQPDAIASFTVGGQTYYVTANEGDDRNDFLNPNETTTVGNASYDLDNSLFPNEATLKLNQNLGRLTVSNLPGLRGDTDGDGDIDQIITYGGRSFSILNSSGAIIFDSGAHIDTTIATLSVANFADNRSTAKGGEPEGVTTATIGGRVYAFIGLERFAGTMVYDVTNPTDPSFVTFASNPAAFASNTALQRPEGGLFISADDSPTGRALYIVSNEGTGGASQGSIVAYNVNSAPVGVNDSNAGDPLVEDLDPSSAGSVLSNDTDIDTGDTKVVTGARAGTEAAGGALAAVAGATIINGTYGQLTINPDGSYAYALNNGLPAIQALLAGQTVVDSFTYRVADGGGLTDTVQLDLTIAGSYDAGDTITGTSNGETLTGSNLAEVINAQGGNDIINGNDGNDTIDGGAGADTLNGGDGIDTASYAEAGAGVGLNLALRGLSGDATGDRFSGIENVIGSGFDDAITGDTGANRIDGDAGNDVLLGARGADTLVGGAGNDVLQGGVDADTFLFSSVSNGDVDVITDFQIGAGDVISFGAGVTVTAAQVMFDSTGATVNGFAVDNSARSLDLVLTLSQGGNTQIVKILDAYGFGSNAYWEAVTGLDLTYPRPLPTGGELFAIA